MARKEQKHKISNHTLFACTYLTNHKRNEGKLSYSFITSHVVSCGTCGKATTILVQTKQNSGMMIENNRGPISELQYKRCSSLKLNIISEINSPENMVKLYFQTQVTLQDICWEFYL